MRLSRKQAFIVAAVIALGAAALVYTVLKKQARALSPAEPLSTTVVVPKTTIPVDTTITAAMVETSTILRKDAPAQALTDANQAIGQLAQFELLKGRALTRADVMARSARGGLTFVIPESMRAATVALDPITGVAGFIQPGDRVDVLATFVQAEMTVTKTILQDVQVLAMGRITSRPSPKKAVATDEGAEKEGEEAPAIQEVTSATVAVTPHEAQILILSASKGTIAMVLRARDDREMAALMPSNDWALAGLKPPPPKEEAEEEKEAEEEREKEEAEDEKEKAEKEPEKPPPPSVEVLRGSEREVVVVE